LLVVDEPVRGCAPQTKERGGFNEVKNGGQVPG
jgi:hypothetical protein